ncbi:hypothetical protein B9Z55_027475 [Caenorhabditis nigoni]|uniref:Uncharacterized protein n=1 Tax=Caenorhabditis nigoni TaxID=1611254 RepID=A0A2G5SFT0_9PELO|nr:hypothetical protein B9Z55_027475 [Caenorhabditis nigoni]
MADLESPSSKKEENLRSTVSKKQKNIFAIYSDELKDALESGDVSTFEKLEGFLIEAKEVLAPSIDKKKKDVWHLTLVSFGLIFTTYMLIGLSEDFFLNGTGSWSKAFIVDTVILILLVGFIIVEKIINQIANWKRRRNTKITVSLEDGDEKKYQIFTIGNDSEDMMNRYQKLVKDLNEYYIPMWNRFKRLYDRFALCSVVTFFVLLTMLTPSIIDDFFHNTEQSLQTTFFGIAKSVSLIYFSFCTYPAILRVLSFVHTL